MRSSTMPNRSITVFDPVADMERFGSLFDAFFPTRANASRFAPEGTGMPIDIFEKEGSIVVRASVPGVRPENVEVSIEGRVLSIRGQLSFEEEHKDAKVYRREITSGTFARSVRLPEDVDVERVEATFENGFVTVTIPKTVESKPAAIKVPVKPATAQPSNN
ncbi:MAG: Hsp20/alpha crystallin family protein [Fimbriimonadaceae bacterium]|nr:Hsp20/alpha crystallin family protein [Fimbriimonadaceae bacterium]QYK56293.1 MAG: Hsp20/alpha crystallin family protein [Fimbriimonadaceae bacterium]